MKRKKKNITDSLYDITQIVYIIQKGVVKIIDYTIFKKRFESLDTQLLKDLLAQYEWEVENHLARHDISIEALKVVLDERQ